MTPSEEKMIQYLEEVFAALKKKSLEYHSGGKDEQQKFARMAEIKNAIRDIAPQETFGIGAGEYSSCPSGVCVGGVCLDSALTDNDLKALAAGVNLEPKEMTAGFLKTLA